MARPSVTVVVPFLGSDAELAAVARRFAGLRRRRSDGVAIADNSPRPRRDPGVEGVRVVRAAGLASSYFARNAGAATAAGEWLVFCDADTEPVAALIEAYLDPPPGERTAILAGGVRDHPEGGSLAARLARQTGAMGQRASLDNPYMPYAITANCAIRAEAFREAGGFEPAVRSGGDADLCWRIQRLGWRLEERPGALVDHRNRATMRELWRQRARHGAGAAWLEGRYPGAMPRWGAAALLRDSGRRLAAGLAALGRGQPGEAALAAAEVSGWWAFEAGRRTPNRARRR